MCGSYPFPFLMVKSPERKYLTSANKISFRCYQLFDDPLKLRAKRAFSALRYCHRDYVNSQKRTDRAMFGTLFVN
jgi:hypothetical protein